MTTFSLIGERSSTLIAGSFTNAWEANELAFSMRHDPQMKALVSVVRPNDPQVDRKLEPENRGIWRTLVRSHLVCGALGLATGVLSAVWLMAFWPAASASPWFAVLFIGSMGLFVGLLIGGLVTMRPDHGWVADRVRSWLQQGRVALVIHPVDEAAARLAFDRLSVAGASPVRSL